MPNVQNYFVQITIQKGRILENNDGSLEKVVDVTIKDDVFPFSDESSVSELSERMLANSNLDFENMQEEML